MDPFAEPHLHAKDFAAEPLEQYRRWRQAAEELGLKERDAVVLATASDTGQPSARMVLVRGVDEKGFTFFTNYQSRKGQDLEANPRAALLHYWDALGRQVRVEGSVTRCSDAESDAYFRSRDPGSRISASISPQSDVVATREELLDTWRHFDAKYTDDDIPRPAHWGGYRLHPDLYEFWENRANRLHDRLRYRRSDGGWVLERLAP